MKDNEFMELSAKTLADAIDDLNGMIRRANADGLRVELDVVEIRTMQNVCPQINHVISKVLSRG